MDKSLQELLARYVNGTCTERYLLTHPLFKAAATGDVSRMALYDMLDVISNSIGSTYEVKGTRILVSGKGCN